MQPAWVLLLGTIVLPVLILGKTPGWPGPYWDIPGDYCRARYHSLRCCEGRNDPCSVPILGTLCYCDRFCNRTESSDCCPDYFSHCEGLDGLQYAEQAPEELVRPEGKALGSYYLTTYVYNTSPRSFCSTFINIR